MRKIVIDDRIRSFAEDYKTKFLEKCTSVKDDLETFRDNVLKFNKLPSEDAVKGYIDTLILEYSSLLTIEPCEWNDKIKEFDTFIQMDKELLSRPVVYRVKDDGKGNIKNYSEEFYKRIVHYMRYIEGREILGPIHQEMGLKACVYCNTQPTRADKDGDVFYEMDHLKPKSTFPFLCSCFYNLQPADSSCNKRKSIKPCEFNLFTNKPDDVLMPFKFVPKVLLNKALSFKCSSIDFTNFDDTITNETDQYNETFHIKSLYSAYHDVVDRIYQRNKDYCSEGMQSSYYDAFKIRTTRQEVISFLMDTPYDDQFIHEDTMRKLKYDTMKQMDNAGELLPFPTP